MAPQAKIDPGWHYERAEEVAFTLDQVLSANGVRIEPGSTLEKHILQVIRLANHKRAGDRSLVSDDIREDYRTLMGVHELAEALVAVRDSPSFGSLVPHLALLNKGAALQNTRSHSADQATNKLFELFVGAVVMQCGSDVILDHPEASEGSNPDILATLAGSRWGIACKVLHGLHPQGFMDHLEKGIDQIQRSPAETGVVFFNLKNVLPHDQIWPLADIPGTESPHGTPDQGPAAWSHASAPFDILVGTLDKLGETLMSYLPADHLDSVFRGKKSLPGFLLWASSASAVRIEERLTPTTVRALNFRYLAPISASAECVLRCVDWAINTGAPASGPKPAC
jgi:hypothetical protein